jgi:hypothetical protein
MLAQPKLSAGPLTRRAVALALAVCLLPLPGAALAARKDKKRKPATGRIEVSTRPGGYPLTIDGQPAGETTDYVRAIELDPGTHTVEIRFPNDTRWSQVFNIVAGRKDCITLDYKPRTIEVPPFVYPTDPTPPQGGKVATVELGDVTGTVCDCGEIPPPQISKEGWWGRRAWRKVRRK